MQTKKMFQGKDVKYIVLERAKRKFMCIWNAIYYWYKFNKAGDVRNT